MMKNINMYFYVVKHSFTNVLSMNMWFLRAKRRENFLICVKNFLNYVYIVLYHIEADSKYFHKAKNTFFG